MRIRPVRTLVSLALTSALALGSFALPASASTGSQDIQVDRKGITVTLDGSPLALADAKGDPVEPFAYQGTTYLPLRAVAGALGLTVAWDAASSTVSLTSGGERSTGARVHPTGTTASAVITVDYQDIKVTLDGAPLTLTDAKGDPVEPFAYQGTTYLPLRAVAGALGLTVAWDAASSTVALASAGGRSGAYTTENAVRHIRGLLDLWYKGVYDEQFLAEEGMTLEEAQAGYLYSVRVEVDSFTSLMTIDYPEDVYDRLTELWKQISAKADYTVVSATGPDQDGTFAVKVTFRPLDIYKLIDEAFPNFSAAFEAPFADVDVEAMSADEFDDWYQNVYDKAYRDSFCDLLEDLIPKIGYLPEQTVIVQVELDPEGVYGLNVSDNSRLANAIIRSSY